MSIFLTHSEAAVANYYGAEALARLQALGPVKRNPHPDRPLTTMELIAAAEGARVIVSDRQTPGEAAVFKSLPGLEAFVRCAVDIRNVDVAAASAAGVLVTHASPGFVPAVAEWVLGAMIGLGRGFPAALDGWQKGRQPEARMGVQLAGSTAGVIGYGAIGREVVRLLKALGMTLLVADPHASVPPDMARQVPLKELLRTSDFIVCLAVANAETENLIDAAAFAAMKPGAFFINASRGNLVDESALLVALGGDRLAGAALDVGRAPDQMPTAVVASHPKVLATPHIGGLTPPAIRHQAIETTLQVAAILKGTAPQGAVNEDKWQNRGNS